MQQAIDERHSSNDVLNAMLDRLPVAALFRDGDAVRMNGAAEALTGYREDELPYDREWFDTLCARSTERRHASPEGAPHEEMIVAKDGSIRFVECLVHPGDARIVLLHDVTSRKRKGTPGGAPPPPLPRETVPALLLDFVCVFTMAGRFHDLHGSWEELLGYGTEELLGRSFAELVHPNDLEASLRAFEILVQNEPISNFCNRLRRKDGSYRWLEWKALPPDERALIYATPRDITTQKELEETLRSREQLFRGLFHNAPVGIYQSDADGKHFIANQRWYEYAGVSTDKIDTHGLGLSASEEDRERISAMWKNALESGKEWSSEYSYRTEDGRKVWVHGTALQILDEERNVIGYLGCNIDITERRVAEEALRTSEHRFRLAMEATNDGLWDIDLERNRYYFSPGCYRMLGYDPQSEQKTPREWFELLHPEDRSRILSAYQGCVQNHTASFEVEVRILSKEGKWKWILSRGKATSRDAVGKPPRMVGTYVDIGERKVMEEMLRKEHGLLNLITDTSPVGILFMEPGGRIAFANRRLEEITGFSKDELKGAEISVLRERMTPRDPAAGSAEEVPSQGAVTADRSKRDLCLEFQRKDGRRILLSVNSAPFFDEYGRVGGVVETIEDVTERKEAEQQISDSQWLLQESQRIALLGSFVYDVSSDSWCSSSKLDDILGIGPGFRKNLQGYLDIVHPDFFTICREGFLHSIRTGERFELEHKVVRVCNGEERWVAGFVEPVGNDSGVVLRVVATIQDITERKAHEEAIRHLNEELDRRVIERTTQLNLAKREMESFSYSVSHDLRAPLRHINSYCTILAEDFADELPLKAHYYLDRICAASSRMGKLIDDLLKLSRINRAEMKQGPFKISKVAQDVADALRERCPEREVQFVIAEGLMAKGDRYLVRQVLENLMENAVKYTSKGESARIEFGRTMIDGRQAFFVRDDGAGFDMQYADKLFHPFQRLHGSEFEGTGIGLATVKRIIERHGGRVWANGAVGEGAAFFFTLSGGGRGVGAERHAEVAAP